MPNAVETFPSYSYVFSCSMYFSITTTPSRPRIVMASSFKRLETNQSSTRI